MLMHIMNVPLKQTKKHFKHGKYQSPSCSCNSAVIHKHTHMLLFIFQTLCGQGDLYDSSVTFYFVWESKKTKKAVAARLVKHEMMKMSFRSHSFRILFNGIRQQLQHRLSSSRQDAIQLQNTKSKVQSTM